MLCARPWDDFDDENPNVKKIVHEKRFINQEKIVFSHGSMQTISPLSVLTPQFISFSAFFGCGVLSVQEWAKQPYGGIFELR